MTTTRFTKEQLIEDLKASTQNASGMFEISEDTICALMSMLTSAAPQLPQPAVFVPSIKPDWMNNEFNAGWNACRAAMLQGSQPVSNRDELPPTVRQALTQALAAMEFMGDTLNNLDAVCGEEVDQVTPAFEAVRALLAGNSPVTPDGWVMVPVAPTEEMLAELCLVKGWTDRALNARYQAMLAAAPKPEA